MRTQFYQDVTPDWSLPSPPPTLLLLHGVFDLRATVTAGLFGLPLNGPRIPQTEGSAQTNFRFGPPCGGLHLGDLLGFSRTYWT
jgi:hypothetical protein